MAASHRERAQKAWKKHRREWFESERAAPSYFERSGYEVVAIKRGVPDAIVSKDGKLFFFEIKRGKNRLTRDQAHVLDRLRALGFEARVLRYWPKSKTFTEGER